jgi:Xaa-Pro dipeptidase
MISSQYLAAAQEHMRSAGIDAWLVYDFRHGNPVFAQLTGGPRHTTRRCYLLVPASGAPRLLLHFIDANRLADLGWDTTVYYSRFDLERELRALLGTSQRVALEYSPFGAIPVVSRVDAGTVEWVRSFGVEVVSSADLIQYAAARWTPEQLASHRSAAAKLGEVASLTFQHAGERLGAGISEYDLVLHMRDLFSQRGLVTEDGPAASVDAHSGDPHYEPTADGSALLRPGGWLLLDIWAKEASEDAVYADITWVGHAGRAPTDQQARLFGIVRDARDRAIDFLRDAHRQNRAIAGWEVDRAAREVIDRAGLGRYFTHRLGHSIGTAVHSTGANLDDFETQDTRTLIPGICFSVEPGIYLPDLGVRSEVDVYMTLSGPEVTTGVQTEIVRIGE